MARATDVVLSPAGLAEEVARLVEASIRKATWSAAHPADPGHWP